MRNKLIFLLYLIPALAISFYFLTYNQVNINLITNDKNVTFRFAEQEFTCKDLECELLVPRNLKVLEYSKEDSVKGSLKINTYKDRQYTINLQKISTLKKLEDRVFVDPFLVKKENQKYILYSNFESLFPLASFPSLQKKPDLFYSSNLNWVLLSNSSTGQRYMFDTKNNQKIEIDFLKDVNNIKVLNNGNLLYKNSDNLIVEVNQNQEIQNYYNLDSLNHIYELENKSFLIISKDINNFITDENGINFAYEVSKSFLREQEDQNYKVYIYESQNKYKQVLSLDKQNPPFRLLKDHKEDNKIYLQSLDGLFEISL